MGKILKKKNITLISNVILAVIAISVAAVCFMPKTAIPASGKAPYYHGKTDGGRISLMFNVYEGEDIVNGILDVLDEYGVKATFFMGGCFADDHEELLKNIASRGHEIGNHGYFHLDHNKISADRNREEIENTGKIITALCGVKPTLFAPPSGSFSTDTLTAAESLGYTVVMWTKDTIDWRDADKNKVYNRATKNAKAGDLVLMHPKKHTLEALPSVLDFYAKHGLKQSTVSANLFGE